MELKEGMYVRTKKGKIYKFESDNSMAKNGAKKYMVNCSYNIIDLIEEGDYVNGHQVYEVDRECCRITLNGGSYGDEFRLTYLRPALGENMGIKSIVTKEQFESISYKVNK